MLEILKAENIKAAYNEIEDGSMMQTGRKLFVDYGWCFSSEGFIDGTSEDSSNYCDPNQDYDSSIGYGTGLSSCYITHNQCLNSGKGSIIGSSRNPFTRCTEVKCRGLTCDANLSSCVWNVSCCGFSFLDYSCDTGRVGASTGISALFGTGSSSP